MGFGMPQTPIPSRWKSMVEEKNRPILDIQNLKVGFDTVEGMVHAVEQVSFTLEKGKVTALVGESGCGKSVTAYSIMRLIEAPGRIMGGKILFNPTGEPKIDIAALSDNSELLYKLRGNRLGMIFQEPMTSLSPVHTVGNQVTEALKLHTDLDKAQAKQACIEMLGHVGIPGPEKRFDQYPFEMSGGMRQRIVIAMAMICHPDILIADEPTTALDVTIQAQVLELMQSLRKEFGTAILLITHDLGVVAQVAEEMAVMYLGRIIEKGKVREIIASPLHPYTAGLLSSLPGMHPSKSHLPSIPGTVPSLFNRPEGCEFHPRCPFAKEGVCDVKRTEVIEYRPGQWAMCHRVGEIDLTDPTVWEAKNLS